MRHNEVRAYANGVEVVLLNAVVDDTDNGYVQLVEVVGSETSVKTVVATIIGNCKADEGQNGGKVVWEFSGKSQAHGRDPMKHYTFQIRPATKDPARPMVSDQWVYGALLLKIFGAEDPIKPDDWQPSEESRQFGILLTDPNADPVDAFYGRLTGFLAQTPVTADWRQWLWATFQRKGWIHQSRTEVGEFRAWHVLFQEAALQEEIRNAIRRREKGIVEIFGEHLPQIDEPEDEDEDEYVIQEGEVFRYNKNILLTDGVRSLCNQQECWWLIDCIASYQQPEFSKEEFQAWKVWRVPDTSAVILECEDGNGNSIFKKVFGDTILLGDNQIPIVRLYTRLEYDCDPDVFVWMRTHIKQIQPCQLIPFSDLRESEIVLWKEFDTVMLPEER